MSDESAVPRVRCLGAAPGMPTADLARTCAHYTRLGFTFWPQDADPDGNLLLFGSPVRAAGDRSAQQTGDVQTR